MIDTHCHIQTEQFDSDREEVLANALAAGVSHFIVPAIDLASFDATLKVSSENQNVFCALGIHPHSAKEWSGTVRERIIQELDTNPKIVAIGEIGLDYYYDFCPKEIQIKAFREQIELAIERKLPIIIHTRDSIDETLAIVEEYYQGLTADKDFGQFHCFSGNAEQMNRAVSAGFCVSYTGNITFKNSTLTDVVRQTPEDRILIETDSPYLAPVPHRGKRNSPEYIGLVAKRIAEIKQKEINEIMTLTTQNAKRLFLSTTGILFLALFLAIPTRSIYSQVGGKPPDSVMTKERRENEEIIKKQRDELLRAQEERRVDSVKAVQLEQDEMMREAMEQSKKDSLRAISRIADEARMREKLKTPIAWKAIGVGGGIGVGNLSGVSQGNRSSLAPTSVLATSFSIGTAITRGIDFEASYNSFSFGDDLRRDQLYKADINGQPSHILTQGGLQKHYLVPTQEDLSNKYFSFDFRFVINPRSPVKFYLGLGYMHVTIENTQVYHTVDSTGTTAVNGPDQTLSGTFTRGGIKGLIGARLDIELGDKFILTPFAQMSAGFLFSGTPQPPGFDFIIPGDPIVFTHLNVGAMLYFGWFGVQRK
ncbi:MAG: YchF/TatD family DNA exonuclease [Ignavibacteriota bacterium]